MMYPDEIPNAKIEGNVINDEFQHNLSSVDTISLPFSLLSLFGGKPKSSRLEIAPAPKASPAVLLAENRDEELLKPAYEFEDIHVFENRGFYHSRPQLTTVTSAAKFSIISTSTQTSEPNYGITITTNEPDVSEDPTGTTHMPDEEYNQMTTQEVASTSSTTSPEMKTLASSKTTGPTKSMRSTTVQSPMSNYYHMGMKNDAKVNSKKNNMQNEFKYQEVMTSTNMESIHDDNLQVSTPSSPDKSTAAHPHDLQLSESITCVYLQNSPTNPAQTENTDTTTTTKQQAVTKSISLMPYSKLASHLATAHPVARRKQLTTTTEQPTTENIFTVTPLYAAASKEELDDDSTTQTAEADKSMPQQQNNINMYNSGHYHEVNPGQYHEIHPGQYHEVHPGQYNELHPGQPVGQFHNFEKSYSRDYEVNDVKVDFDHQDEHKIYNVQAKAGDFIIGEVGRIDVNNGQTLEGVRYTALEGEVDPRRISQILQRFFGTGGS